MLMVGLSFVLGWKEGGEYLWEPRNGEDTRPTLYLGSQADGGSVQQIKLTLYCDILSLLSLMM